MDFYKLLSSTDSKHPGGSAANNTTVTWHMFIRLAQKKSVQLSSVLHLLMYKSTQMLLCV